MNAAGGRAIINGTLPVTIGIHHLAENMPG